MNNESHNLTWQERLRYEFRRNRKKSAMLTILLVVCLAMVARLVFKKSPSAAGGATAAVVDPQAVPAGAAPLPAAGIQGPGAPALAAATPAAAGRTRPATPVKVEFVRDIFRPDPAAFTGNEEEEALTLDDARIQVRLEANALHLTSTMVGEVSCVTINGQLLRPNDWIEGFQVAGIGKGLCIVVKKGVRVQLDMEN